MAKGRKSRNPICLNFTFNRINKILFYIFIKENHALFYYESLPTQISYPCYGIGFYY